MRRTRLILSSGVAALAVAGMLWSGCGDDDHDGADEATIRGNVAAVSPAQARNERASHRWLARLDSLLVRDAIAQGTCPAAHTGICASNGVDPIVCAHVDPTDCTFSLRIDTLGDFSSGTVSFFDDTNGNEQFDQGELFAILTNQLVPLCNGTTVTLNDVSASFTTLTATAASVVKDPDVCAGTPTATARATSTPVVTQTPTPPGGSVSATQTAVAAPTRTAAAGAILTQTAAASATGTPYAEGAALNDPPPSWLALLSGLGIVGLLVPRRRGRR